VEHDFDPYKKEMEELIGQYGGDGIALIAMGLAMVADSIRNAAWQLGRRDAATPMGALEQLGDAVLKGCNSIADALPTRLEVELDTPEPVLVGLDNGGTAPLNVDLGEPIKVEVTGGK